MYVDCQHIYKVLGLNISVTFLLWLTLGLFNIFYFAKESHRVTKF